MKLGIMAAFFAFQLAAICWGQDSEKKSLPPECTKLVRVQGSLPKGPFKTLPGESYKGAVTIKYEIQEDGTVSNATITRSSGLADMDQRVLDAVAHWRYKPRHAGCAVIETQMSVLIHQV